MAMGELAARVRVPLSTATRVVDRMVERDLVQRERPKDNRRVVRVALAPAGQRFYDEALAARVGRHRADAPLLDGRTSRTSFCASTARCRKAFSPSWTRRSRDDRAACPCDASRCSRARRSLSRLLPGRRGLRATVGGRSARAVAVDGTLSRTRRAVASDVADWWQHLGDAQLTSLIARAARREPRRRGRAREAARSARSSAVSPAPSSGRASRSAPRGSTSTRAPTRRTERRQELYNVGFDASWEPDLFGGQRRALEAASADVRPRR